MKKHKIVLRVAITLCIGVLIIVALRILGYSFYRNHGNVSTQGFYYTQSSRKLDNPNRGFYYIYGFVIADDNQNFEEQVAQKMCYDTNELAQIQVNLRNYLSGDITQAGLDNIKALFDVLRKREKQYIVRFLYDWGGNFEQKEPESLDIILAHMKQLEPIFQENQDIIFVHQGILVGACGEMHDSKHLSDEDMNTLLLMMVDVTNENIYLSVRTPQQWRKLTGISEPDKEILQQSSFAYRLGLFNDGIMGTSLDTGTYGNSSKAEAGVYAKWKREEELAFQSELCRLVPNGGEVIINNPVNDFENAVRDMAIMHITYLNQQYDRAVLNKWAETIVAEDGCFKGMDGLSYVERHLGYRLQIQEVDLNYEFWPDVLRVNVTLQNVGFAPMYKQPDIYCILSKTDGTEIRSFEIQEDIRVLTGGNEADKLLTIGKDISLAGFAAGEYDVYFLLKDTDSGKHILLANEQDEEALGYKIGQISIEPLKNPITGKEIDFKNIIGTWFQEFQDKTEK